MHIAWISIYLYCGKKVEKSGKLLMFLLMIPVYTSSLARLYSLVIMFNSSGLINTALMKLHIISSPLQILYTNGSITIGLVQYLLPHLGFERNVMHRRAISDNIV